MSEAKSSEKIQPVYITFTEETTIDQGIELIETQIFDGKSFKVTRRDEAGNAIVARITATDADAISKLHQVSLVKVETEAKLTAASDTISEIQDNKLDTSTNHSYTSYYMVAAILGLAIIFGVLFFKKK